MVAEYLDRYKHYPPADMSWHEFAALVDRSGQFQARDRLIFADAVAMGQPAQDGSELAQRMLERQELQRIAWPSLGR